MRSIDDERVLFYLKHEAVIEEWANVRTDVASTAHRFYLSLAEDLEAPVVELGDDVMIWVNDGTWAHVGLYRESWLSDASTPLAIATLEWNRGGTLFQGGLRLSGIRCDINTDEGKRLRAATANLVRDKRSSLGYPHMQAWWPAQRPVPGPAEADYWLDLDPFRRALVDEIVDAWNTFSEFVDEAMKVLSEG